jgi:hypothetical protein
LASTRSSIRMPKAKILPRVLDIIAFPFSLSSRQDSVETDLNERTSLQMRHDFLRADF